MNEKLAAFLRKQAKEKGVAVIDTSWLSEQEVLHKYETAIRLHNWD